MGVKEASLSEHHHQLNKKGLVLHLHNHKPHNKYLHQLHRMAQFKGLLQPHHMGHFCQEVMVVIYPMMLKTLKNKNKKLKSIL